MPVVSGGSLPTSALVFGLGASGKSTVIADRVTEAHKGARIFWMSLDNTAIFEDRPALLDAVDLAVYRDFPAWKSDVERLIKLPDADQYDVVVLDGVAALRRLAIKAIAKNPQPSTPEWGQMSEQVHSLIRGLKDATTHLYASALLVHENIASDGAPVNMQTFFDLNNDLKKRLIPEFNKKLYTFVEPRVSAEGTVNGLNYVVQNNAAAALRFSTLQF
jgi:hypothetical protein